MKMFEPLRLRTGQLVRNRLMLAPLTTQQSHDDGRVSRADRHWLELRAAGGFGLILTAAAAVSRSGQAFPGQYGLYSDAFLPGLSRLAAAVNRHGAASLVQLQHGGGRSLSLTDQVPVSPSDSASSRALRQDEMSGIVEDFAASAERSLAAGFDGVQVHAAYGFLLAQFLDPQANRRTDAYGGSLDNRARLLREVLDGIRRRMPDAVLSVRLNATDRGLRPAEMLELASELLVDKAVDHVDLVIESFDDPLGSGGPPLAWLRRIGRGAGLLGLTGGFSSGDDIERGLDQGADLIGIGTAAVLHADLPKQFIADGRFRCQPLPATAGHLGGQGVSPPFLDYLRRLPGFVADDRIAA